MKCHLCGLDDPFPFKCIYCGEYFCSEHRLPENHFCPMYATARRPNYVPTSGSISYTPTFKPGRVGKREAFALLVGAFLVWLVGSSLFGFSIFSIVGSYYAILLNSTIFVASFVLHEYAHKYAANLNGFWAEFKLSKFGVLVTAISIFSPFKFISPGATVIFGEPDKSTVGKIAMWGPLVNIIISIALFPIVLFIAGGDLLAPAYAINGWIAVFNLIPLFILDGRKIFDWNKAIWSAMMIYSVAITAFAFIYL